LYPEGSKSAELWLATPPAAEWFSAAALTDAEAQRYSELRSPGKRRDFAVSRSLCAFLDIQDPRLGTLSHSGGYAALVRIGGNRIAGVDVQVHAPKRLSPLARFAYSDAEAHAIEAASDDRRARLFYALWTLKEAFAKALALPLLEATRTCTFEPFGDTLLASVPARQPWNARVFEPRPNVSVAAVVLGSDTRFALPTREWPPPADHSWPEPFVVQARRGTDPSR
jgi:hypothetical protein